MEKVKNDSKNVHKKRPLFFQLGLIISLLLSFAAFEFKVHLEEGEIVVLPTEEPPTFMADNIKPTVQPPKAKPLPPQNAKSHSIHVTDEPKTNTPIQANDIPSINVDELNDLVAGGAPTAEMVVDPTIHIVVDAAPTFKGGLNAFYNYLQEEMKYPSHERKVGIEGKVYLQFVIEVDGSLTDIQVLKPVSEGLDKEAIRVLKASPVWEPGTIRGQAVRTRMTIPLNFQLR